MSTIAVHPDLDVVLVAVRRSDLARLATILRASLAAPSANRRDDSLTPAGRVVWQLKHEASLRLLAAVQAAQEKVNEHA